MVGCVLCLNENYREIVGDDTLIDEGDGAFGQLRFAFSFDAANVAEFFRIVLLVLFVVIYGESCGSRVVVVYHKPDDDVTPNTQS